MASAVAALSIPLPNGARLPLVSCIPFALFHLAALGIFFVHFKWTLSSRLLSRLRSPHVLRHRRLPSLFFTPLFQDQSLVPVRPRLDGHVLFAKGRPLVGSPSSPPSPLFRSGRGSPLTHAFRFLVVARRLDSFGQVQFHALRLHWRLRQISRTPLAQQVLPRSSNRSRRSACGSSADGVSSFGVSASAPYCSGTAPSPSIRSRTSSAIAASRPPTPARTTGYSRSSLSAKAGTTIITTLWLPLVRDSTGGKSTSRSTP